MREGLNQVDWAGLTDCRGKATEIPFLIRKLASTSGNSRESISWDLWDRLNHQGTIYQATSYAIPFLIELLQYEGVPEKHSILSLLRGMGHGHIDSNPSGGWREDGFARSGRDIQAEYALYASYVSLARAAVLAGIPVYLSLTVSIRRQDRIAAVDLLGFLGELPQDILPILFNRLQIETEPDVKAHIVNAAGNLLLPLDNKQRHPYFAKLQLLLDSPAEKNIVRFSVATVIAKHKSDISAEKIAAILTKAITYPAGLHENWWSWPPGRSIYRTITVEEACHSLSLISAPIFTSSLLQGLSQIKSTQHAHYVSIMLLSFVLTGLPRALSYSGMMSYTETEITYEVDRLKAKGVIQKRIYPIIMAHNNPEDLNPLQRQALLAVLKCKAVWRIHSNILEMWGLAGSRADLLAASQ